MLRQIALEIFINISRDKFTNCQIESTAFTAEPPTEFVYNFLTQTQTDRTRVDRIKISRRISCGPTVSGEGEKGGEEKL